MERKDQRFYQSLDWKIVKRLASGIIWRDKFYRLNIERLRSRIFKAEEYIENVHAVHSLPHYHIALYTDNKGSWLDENGIHQAQEHELLLIPPYSPHMILACRPETYRIIILTFSYYCNNEILDIPFERLIEHYSGCKIPELPKNIPLSRHKASQMEELLERLLDELLSTSSCREVHVQECFLKLITSVYELSKQSISNDLDTEIREKMARIKKSFDRTPENNTPLNELAEKVHMSKEHFIRTFKKIYGDPPGRFRQLRRLEKAVKLLLNSNMKIKDIATNCGFESIFYFSKIFKQHFSVSPKEYRRQAERD